MIRRRDRVVKVLDFGLAKVTERKDRCSPTINPNSKPRQSSKLFLDILMGTINYMSPEQAQAQAIDRALGYLEHRRNDLRNGRGLMPFQGATMSHTIVQILEKEPVPLTQFTQRKAPEELQRIVGKALSKNPDERYQTAKDMLIDLQEFEKAA